MYLKSVSRIDKAYPRMWSMADTFFDSVLEQKKEKMNERDYIFYVACVSVIIALGSKGLIFLLFG